MNKAFFIIMSFLILSCNPNNTQQNKSDNNRSIEWIPEHDLDLRLAGQKHVFDKGVVKGFIKKIQNSKGVAFKEYICSYDDIKTPIFYTLAEWSKSVKIDLE